MPAYIEEQDRDQAMLLPERVDDYVSPNDPIRVLDAFVDELAISKLGFKVRERKDNGRPSYSPSSMIKLLIWGYLNRCKSSRQLEQACKDRLGVIWLTRKITPDHSTIAEFRKQNAKGLKKLLKEFNKCCFQLDVFAGELIAIDGTFIKAVNNNKKYLSKSKLNAMIKRLEETIDEYFEKLSLSDKANEDNDLKAETEISIREKIESLKARKEQHQESLKECEQASSGAICHTDSDARPLRKGGKTIVGYNTQAAVDAKHHLVVCSEIVEAANDRNQLHSMSVLAKENLPLKDEESEPLKVIADAGYGTAAEVAANDTVNIESHVLFQTTSAENNSYFSRGDFEYSKETDSMRCPNNQLLPRRADHKDSKSGTVYKVYGGNTKTCSGCSLKDKCTTSKWRKIRVNVDQAAADQCVQRTKQQPSIIAQRSSIVEHPFGTLKHVFFPSGLTCIGKEMAEAETSLGFLCYNIRRVLNIVDVVSLVSFITGKRALKVG